MWSKRADTIVHERSPFNAEPSRSALAQNAITSIDTFYSRNTAPSPTSTRTRGG